MIALGFALGHNLHALLRAHALPVIAFPLSFNVESRYLWKFAITLHVIALQAGHIRSMQKLQSTLLALALRPQRCFDLLVAIGRADPTGDFRSDRKRAGAIEAI